MRISDWSSDVCSSDLVHLRLNLLAHRAAQQIGFAKRIARQYLGGLHHLFLIDEDAVGLAQHRLQQRMRIFDLLPPVLARAAGGDIVHRTGAIERHQRDDVRSEEHTSELQSTLRLSYASFCLITRLSHT